MEYGDTQRKSGKVTLSTYGILHPSRERFNLRPEIDIDLQHQIPV